MKIHIHRAGEDFGPYPLGAVNEYLRSGRLRPQDHAWYEGAPDWMTLAEVPGVELPLPVDPATPEVAVEYHHVAMWKFVILSLLTMGFYELYWFYRNWKFIKQRDGSDIMPFWRAVFSIIWVYPLAKDIAGNPIRPMATGWGAIATAYIVLSMSWRLPDPVWVLSLLGFVPLCFLVRQIHSINLALGRTSPYFRRFGFWPIATSLAGAAFLFLSVGPLVGLFVPEGVVSGEAIRQKDRDLLEVGGMLHPDEQPLYFYSLGLFSVADEGNLLTDRRVVSYVRESDGELWIGEARFDEIHDIQTAFSDSEWKDSEVFIQTDEEENGFYLALSTVDEGDHLFVDKLTELWNASREAAAVTDQTVLLEK